MRKVLVASTLVLLASVVAPAPGAGAQTPGPGRPVSIRFRDAGVLKTAPLPRAASLSSSCGSGTAGGSDGTPIDVVFEEGQQGRILLRNDRTRGFVFSGVGGFLPKGTVCTASPELQAALAGARQAPARRGPWVALVASMAGLGLLILLVAAAGLGIGPRPELETMDDPHADHGPDDAHRDHTPAAHH
ncbi:MAG TPA: hypothetical protein VNE62_12585 [Actinomycetota bacterium]|nr:hypothetical protein [Actinomycetota bacterium]